MSITKKITENAKTKMAEGFISPEDKRYMEGKPNRIEVANYVNSLIENHYMPTITNYIQMSSMVLQAILIEKGVCTGEEIKEITEKFVEENQKRIRDKQVLRDINDPSKADLYKEMEDGVVARLNDACTNHIWEDEELSEDEVKSISTTIYNALTSLLHLNTSEDTELIKTIQNGLKGLIDEMLNLKASLDNKTIAIKDINKRDDLISLISDTIGRLEKHGDKDGIKKS